MSNDAHELADQIQQLAATKAQIDQQLLTAIAEFDRMEGWNRYDGLTSTAHWLAWACSMSAHTAREHVRMARALVDLPKVDALFAEGRLSFSKVRELTRAAPAILEITGGEAEERLCALALEMTASQLSRTVRAFGACAGSRLQAEPERRVRWCDNGDGTHMVAITCTADEAALMRTATEVADEPSQPDAVIAIMRHFLDSRSEQRRHPPADDHHLVVVQVDAETLIRTSEPQPEAAASPPIAHILGAGPIEAQTAARYACGVTDLSNLLLLCHRHHTSCHEGGLSIAAEACDGRTRWVFRTPRVSMSPIPGPDPTGPPLSHRRCRRCCPTGSSHRIEAKDSSCTSAYACCSTSTVDWPRERD